MTAEQICKAAQNNEPMPSELTLAQQYLYGIIRNIYGAYRSGLITAEQGKNEKNLALARYEEIHLWEKIFRRQAKMSVELGKAMCEANKHGCEICRKMAKIIDGRLIPK